MGTELGITPVIIRGEELKQKGFGGTFAGDIYRRLKSPLFDASFVFIFASMP